MNDQQQPPVPEQPASQAYKPNIYPIMYWALLFGIVAGLILLLVSMLASFINIVWVPVFVGGAAWGAYRNYKKQKDEWANAQGVAPIKKSAMEEFRDAARDIIVASREMLAQQAAEDQQAAQQQAPAQEAYEEPPQQSPPQQPYSTPEPPQQPTDQDNNAQLPNK